MKSCHTKMPFVYIRDGQKEPVNHENIYGCVAKMTEITGCKSEENTFSVELSLLKDPDCIMWFTVPKKIKDYFMEDMRSSNDKEIISKKVMAYVSIDSGIVKALQPDY